MRESCAVTNEKLAITYVRGAMAFVVYLGPLVVSSQLWLPFAMGTAAISHTLRHLS